MLALVASVHAFDLQRRRGWSPFADHDDWRWVIVRIPRQDLAQDRAFWRDLRERASGGGLPAHSAGGFRHRRFAIIRGAAWITLYRVKFPFPQVGVFLRGTGLAGEAFFTLADSARARVEPRLRAEIGPEAVIEWGTSRHPGMTDIAATLETPLPWDDCAAEAHIEWMLRVGAVWWTCFASLAGEAPAGA